MSECLINIYGSQNDDEIFAGKVLSEELQRRCLMQFPVLVSETSESGISLVIDERVKSEGFEIKSDKKKAVITASGRLGLLYGVGRFITESNWDTNVFEWKEMDISDAPVKEMRGMQLTYNSSANAYFNWSKETYEQYIRDLIVFAGANAIEILGPSGQNDIQCAEIRKYPFMEMTAFLSETVHNYGADVWLFYPNLINVFKKEFDPEMNEDELRQLTIERALRERVESFPLIPYIDHILMPSGDPCDLRIDEIFGFADKMYDILKKTHPNAKIWPSCQNTKQPGTFRDQYYEGINKRPEWLGGVVYAPWTDHTITECRNRTPKDLPVRGYPDICHSLCCQFPVHEWDTTYAVTAGRECYNPRPREHKRIHAYCNEYLIGNIPYSEGIADDVSKFIWLSLDWNPSFGTFQILKNFAHNFISPKYSGEFASAVAGIEDVSYGSSYNVAAARSVYDAFSNLNEILPKDNSAFGANSYRFKMAYIMSAFYYYINKRSVYEKDLEEQTMNICDDSTLSVDKKIELMLTTIRKSDISPDPKLRENILALAKELYDLIGWRLNVKDYKAKNYSRGAFIEMIDLHLNNRNAIEARLEKIKGKTDEEKEESLKELRYRRFAGVGGKYISFGEIESMRYIKNADGWKTEPNAVTVPRIEHYTNIFSPDVLVSGRYDLAQCYKERVSSVLGYYDCDVELSVDGLIFGSDYELRIVFPMRFGWIGQEGIPTKIFSGETELQCMGTVENDSWVYVYKVPSECIGCDGVLDLKIVSCEGTRGSGASEIWLIKK